MRAAAPAALFLAVLLSSESIAQEPTFSPPEGWLDAGTDQPVDCPEGLQPQLTNREYRKFAFRNQVWSQASFDDGNWRAGTVVKRPDLRYPKDVQGLPDPLRVVIHVLAGDKGVPLDAIVTCSNAPGVNQAFLGLVPSFKFRPTRYKTRELVTILPVSFDVRR